MGTSKTNRCLIRNHNAFLPCKSLPPLTDSPDSQTRRTDTKRKSEKRQSVYAAPVTTFGRIREIAQNEAGYIRLAVEKQRRGFVEKRFRECRVAAHAFDDG